MKKLYLSNTDKKIAGVCGGLGEYFEMDSMIFRALFLAGLLFGGFSAILYIVMWMIIPRQPQ
jgi:phage shock protein PspC (stress-responsive transcriptional regulator)